MTDDDFASLVARTQEVAIGLASWRQLGDALSLVMGCSRVTLMIGPSDGSTYVDVMEPVHGAEDPGQSAYYRRLDPSLPVTMAIAAHRLDLKEVAQLFELIPEREFRRTEYYSDYARRTGRFHRLGFSGLRGGRRMAPFCIHRPEHAPPFTETERAHMLRLKPFIKNALAVQERSTFRHLAAGAGFCGLDACAQPMLVVDGEQRLVHCNLAAERLLAADDSPLHITLQRHHPGDALREPTTLMARRRSDADALRRMVRSVAIEGRPGGRCRMAARGGDSPGLSVNVMPLLARLMDPGREPGAIPGLAMVMVVDLRRTRNDRLAETLRELFGLSASEAAIASHLADGLTAEQIAARRGASALTVRTQIRAVLRKVSATSLRDLERIMALLPPG